MTSSAPRKIVYSLSPNYYVHLTAKGYEVISPYGYSGTFSTLEAAARELVRVSAGNP